jgi:uncharacterized protein (DUF1778 family)
MPAKRRPKPDPDPKALMFTMRVTAEFRDWLTRAAEHCNLSVADLLTQAVRRYVRSEGFTEPPPQR